MSIKHSLAGKERWKNVSDEEKSRRMSATSKSRWDNVTKDQRRAIALRLVAIRKQKHATAK